MISIFLRFGGYPAVVAEDAESLSRGQWHAQLPLEQFRVRENPFELGRLWETEVLRQLSERIPDDEIKFWRTQDGNEIDFVVDAESAKAAIEVKVNASNANVATFLAYALRSRQSRGFFGIIDAETDFT